MISDEMKKYRPDGIDTDFRQGGILYIRLVSDRNDTQKYRHEQRNNG
jgi:hypothetical protein